MTITEIEEAIEALERAEASYAAVNEWDGMDDIKKALKILTDERDARI